jgi:hypothetical protein
MTFDFSSAKRRERQLFPPFLLRNKIGGFRGCHKENMHSTLTRLQRRLKLGPIGFVGLMSLSCLNPFAPALDKGNLAEGLITDQSTPDEVLTNFKYAYIFRDSLLYADLLDSAFVFQYFDPDQGASGIFVSWTRETDLQATGRLLRTFDAINLEWLNTINPDTLRDDMKNIESISFSKSFRSGWINPICKGIFRQRMHVFSIDRSMNFNERI